MFDDDASKFKLLALEKAGNALDEARKLIGKISTSLEKVFMALKRFIF